MRLTRLVAAAVIAALVGGAVYAAAQDGGSGPVPVTSDAGPASTPTSHIPQVSSTTLPPERPISSATTAVPSFDRHTVLLDGLAAWGRFAVTGDLDRVAPWFSQEGPQWERFESEAPELSADPLGEPPYEVMVDVGDMTGDAGEMRVNVRVTFVRTGESSQTFRWRVVLRDEDDGWRIWTVEAVDSQPSTPSIENP